MKGAGLLVVFLLGLGCSGGGVRPDHWSSIHLTIHDRDSWWKEPFGQLPKPEPMGYVLTIRIEGVSSPAFAFVDHTEVPFEYHLPPYRGEMADTDILKGIVHRVGADLFVVRGTLEPLVNNVPGGSTPFERIVRLGEVAKVGNPQFSRR